MKAPEELLARRAERLLRCYPKSWRSRYADEFTELLIADLEERPSSWRRSGNVAWSGFVARLTAAGLTGHIVEPSDQVRASLASLGTSLGVFLVFAIAIWAQLTVGWQWSEPGAVATSGAMILMSLTMLVLFVVAVLAAVPIGFRVIRSLCRHERELLRPTLLFLAGASLLVVGGRHFANGWPGTGGHPWALRELVPGGVAAFA